MRKTWLYRREGIPSWWVGWYEAGTRGAKAFPNKAPANHFAQIKYQQLNSDVFTSVISDVFTSVISLDWETLRTEYEKPKRVLALTDEAIYQANLTLEHFERICGPLNSKQIAQAALDRFVLQRSKEIKRYTLNQDISNVRAFLNWGRRNKYLSDELRVQKVKVEKKEVRPLDSRQIRNLLVAAGSSRAWYTRILLSLTTGPRKNDAEALRIRDIDFELNAIHTRSRKPRKSMLNRPLPATVVRHLATYVASLPPGQVGLFSGTNTFKKWKAIRMRAGLTDLRYQDLRVTFSTLLAEAGESTSVRQRLLEHSSPQITEDYYTKVHDPVLRQAVNKLPVDEWL